MLVKGIVGIGVTAILHVSGAIGIGESPGPSTHAPARGMPSSSGPVRGSALNHAGRSNPEFDEIIFGSLTNHSVIIPTCTPRKSPKFAPPQSSFRYSVGYVGCWSSDRDCMAVEPDEIDASAYTHITFAYVGMNQYNAAAFDDPERDGEYLRRLVKHVKKTHPSVKILISVGGFSVGGSGLSTLHFSTMVKYRWSRAEFISSLFRMMQEYGVEGVDIAWEFISYGMQDEGFGGLVMLMQEMRNAFGYAYTMSAAIPIGNADLGLDVAAMSPYLDFMTVMSYSLHGVWEYSEYEVPRMLPHADIREIHNGITALVNTGVPRGKLLLGLAFWGQSYKQLYPDQGQIGAPYVDPNLCLPNDNGCTTSGGNIGYVEIAEFLAQKKKFRVRDCYHDPYSLSNVMMHGKDQWVTFDNPATIKARVEYSMKHGMGGVSALFLDLDDEQFSMSKAIIEARKSQFPC